MENTYQAKTKIFLIRHGETNWSYRKKYCGFTDISLNRRGKKQAIKLAQILRNEKIDKVYSSDLKRAFQFAKIIFKNKTIIKLPQFREINFGIFEGLTHQEIMDTYPEIYQKWLTNPLKFNIPSGERLFDFARRIRKSLANILLNDDNKTIAIITHSGPIKVILCDALKLSLKEIWRLKIDLGSLSIVEFDNKTGKIYLLNSENTDYMLHTTSLLSSKKKADIKC